MPEEEKKELHLMVRNTGEYEEAINKIGSLMEDYKFTYVEAFGVIESVKNELQEQQMMMEDD